MAPSMQDFLPARAPASPAQMDIAKSAGVRNEMLDNLARLSCGSQIDRALQEAAAAMLDGRLTETDYCAVGAALTAMRAVVSQRPTVAQRVPSLAAGWQENGQSRFKPHLRKPMPTDKKAEYVQRRRELAASGMMPRQLAAEFTTGQLAALAIVAQEVRKAGRCALVIEKIAGLAGVCHATVRRALSRAVELGLVAIAYRERRGAPSLSNIVTLLSASWRDWINHRKSGPSLAQLLRKFGTKPRPPFFSGSIQQKCNPTPSTSIIKGNRLAADYSITLTFACNSDGRSLPTIPT